MARLPFLRFYTTTIPANGQVTVNHGGTRFVCKESDGVFNITLDDVGPMECEVGIGFKFEDEKGQHDTFKKIKFENPTGAPITVKYWVGTAAVLDSRLNTLVDRTINVTVSSVAPTYTKGSSGTLLAGGSLWFTGLDGTKKRVSFSVFNRSAAADNTPIVVSGNNLVAGHEVDGRQGYCVQAGGFIGLGNPNGVAVDYRAMETFPQ